jgi:hypothetical protein
MEKSDPPTTPLQGCDAGCPAISATGSYTCVTAPQDKDPSIPRLLEHIVSILPSSSILHISSVLHLCNDVVVVIFFRTRGDSEDTERLAASPTSSARKLPERRGSAEAEDDEDDVFALARRHESTTAGWTRDEESVFVPERGG